MRVSVIVPVRNEERSIRALLDSLLGQTRMPDEIVITDGGSIDATTQIIEEYIQRGAPVRLIREGAALPGRGMSPLRTPLMNGSLLRTLAFVPLRTGCILSSVTLSRTQPWMSFTELGNRWSTPSSKNARPSLM
jgi:glycosyltransferase involved in cell wall biosynthesis